LTVFAEELAGMFHRYYSKLQVVNEKHKELSQARLLLINNVKNVLAISFELMGISAPEKM
jgi:arginyl-tRNA synthetase